MRRRSRDGFRRWCDQARLHTNTTIAARRVPRGLRPLLSSAAMRNDIFTSTYSPVPDPLATLPRFPTTTTSSDYCSRLRYWQFSQVPLQNFRDAPPPLPRRAHLAQIESARRCWFHEHRSADHAETFNETLCRKFTCVTARLFVRQDSRTSVALCTACRPNRMSISLRYSSFRY